MSTPGAPAADRIASPYKGLDHYEERDASFFFGRQDTSDLVVANLIAARLTLLYGESGVGKTSLVHAGVIPRLRATPGLAVAVFRSWSSDPVTGLAAAIRAAASIGPQARERSLAATIRAATERLGRDLVIILDQFEEYFVYQPPRGGNDVFAAELARAARDTELHVSFLISIREDALARLDRFKGHIPGLFGNYLRVDHLSRQAGRDAIVRPIEQYRHLAANRGPVSVEPGLVEAVLDQVRVGNVQFGDSGSGVIGDAIESESRPIEAPYLQLVMTRLWEEESGAGSPVLRLETLDRLGRAERIIPAHLEEAMGRLSRKQRNLAARVLRFLVTPSGTKIAHRASDLASYVDVSVQKVASLLDNLSGQHARILRGVSDGRYEIYHDVLAPAILDWTSRRLRAIKTGRLRWWIGLTLLIIVLLTGGSVSIALTAPDSGLGIAGTVVVSITSVAALASLPFGLGVRRGRTHP